MGYHKCQMEPPDRGTYKHNTDGSSFGNPHTGGMGVSSEITPTTRLFGYMKGFPVITNNLAELNTLVQVLKLAVEHKLTPLIINIDSLEVIRMLNDGHLPYDPKF